MGVTDGGVHGTPNKGKAARKAKPAAKRDAVAWVGFIDLPLTEQQKIQFAAFEASEQPHLSDMLEGLAAAGHKISLSYNEKNDTFVAALTGLLRPSRGGNETVSAFAGSLVRAMMLLCFKHYGLANEDWETITAASAPRQDFG